MSGLSLNLGLGLGSVMGGGSPDWLANSIGHFNDGAVDGGLWNIADTTKNNVTIGGGGDDVTDGAFLGRREDLSGNDAHFDALNPTQRPTWDLVGGVAWGTQDGANDEMETAISWSSNMRIYVGLTDVVSQGMLFTGGASSRLIGIQNNGEASTTYFNAGTPADYINNVLVSPATRDGLYDAIVASEPVVYEIRDVDLSAWPQLELSGYHKYSAAWAFDGKVGTIIAFPEASVTADTHRDHYNLIASQIGVPTLGILLALWGDFSGVLTLWGDFAGSLTLSGAA